MIEQLVVPRLKKLHREPDDPGDIRLRTVYIQLVEPLSALQIPEEKLRQTEIVVVVHMRKEQTLYRGRINPGGEQPVNDIITRVDKIFPVDKYPGSVVPRRRKARVGAQKHYLHSNSPRNHTFDLSIEKLFPLR